MIMNLSFGMMRAELQKIADQYGDLGTNNFLTEIMERHEKTAWMLRATLEDKEIL